MPKEGVYRVTWMVTTRASDNTIRDDTMKMSELFRGVNTGDEAIAQVKLRYPDDKYLVKILSVAQLR